MGSNNIQPQAHDHKGFQGYAWREQKDRVACRSSRCIPEAIHTNEAGGWEFIILPDIRTYKMIRNEMRAVYQELCRLRDCSEMDDLLIYQIELLTKFFVGLAGEGYESPLEEEDDAISGMERG